MEQYELRELVTRALNEFPRGAELAEVGKWLEVSAKGLLGLEGLNVTLGLDELVFLLIAGNSLGMPDAEANSKSWQVIVALAERRLEENRLQICDEVYYSITLVDTVLGQRQVSGTEAAGLQSARERCELALRGGRMTLYSLDHFLAYLVESEIEALTENALGMLRGFLLFIEELGKEAYLTLLPNAEIFDSITAARAVIAQYEQEQ